MPRWSEDMTIKFLELYKTYPCLWDQFSPLYKMKSARHSALSEIVSSMNIEGFSVSEAKLKIKALRSTYSGEMSKIERSAKLGSGLAEIYRPSLKWLHLMEHIMEKGTLKRQTRSNLGVEAPVKREVSTDMESNEESAADIAVSASKGEDEKNDSNSSIYLEDVDLEPSPKRRKLHSEMQMIPSTLRERTSLKCSLNKLENEHEVFGRHVVAQLKTLSPKQSIIAISKINSVLTHCRMTDLLEAPRNSTATEDPQPSVPARHFESEDTESSLEAEYNHFLFLSNDK